MSKVDQLRALREAKFSAMHRPYAPTGRVVAGGESVTPAVFSNPDGPGSTPATPVAKETLAPSSPEPATGEPNGSVGHGVKPGKMISAYSPEELKQVIAWIVSTNPDANRDNIENIAMSELGFVRKGKNIRTAMTAAMDELNIPKD